MHIHYITAIAPKNDAGGAGTGVGGLFNSAVDHTIEVFDSPEKYDTHDPDMIWISNLMCKYTLDDLSRITKNFTIPYIVQDDGYMNMCPQPTREYKLCFQDRFLDPEWGGWLDFILEEDEMTYKDCPDICRFGLMVELSKNSRAMVCVSPLHGRIWGTIYPWIKEKTIVYDPQVDVDLFKPTYESMRYSRLMDKYLWAGVISRGKGYYNCLKYVDALGKEIHTVGEIHHTVSGDDVRNWIPRVPHNQMPKIYSSFEYFIHIPDWPEPQGLTVTEAILCGCKVIGNEKVGALTYPWWDEYLDRRYFTIDELPGQNLQEVKLVRHGRKLREFIRESGRRFWKDVESYL